MSARPSAAPEATRSKIQAVAEQLFASEGFDRVPLRQIAREAGQRNVAAVQYHFGSKEGLLSSIVDTHRSEIDDRRRDLLEALTEAESEADLSTLIGILVEPLAAKLDDASGRAYLRIQAQGLTNEKMRPATQSLIRRIRRHLGAIDEERGAPFRDRFALLLLFHALADRARAEETQAARRGARRDFLDSLTRSIEALFAA